METKRIERLLIGIIILLILNAVGNFRPYQVTSLPESGVLIKFNTFTGAVTFVTSQAEEITLEQLKRRSLR